MVVAKAMANVSRQMFEIRKLSPMINENVDTHPEIKLKASMRAIRKFMYIGLYLKAYSQALGSCTKCIAVAVSGCSCWHFRHDT